MEEQQKRCPLKRMMIGLIVLGLAINLVIYSLPAPVHKHLTSVRADELAPFTTRTAIFNETSFSSMKYNDTKSFRAGTPYRSMSDNDSMKAKAMPCLNYTRPPSWKPKGRISVNVVEPTWKTLNELNITLAPGGRYKPTDCDDPDRVAIIIPYRDREPHLKIFLQNMHPFLQRQKIEYGIFVIELADNITFNKAIMMNVGFVEASKRYAFQCYVFHDVDLFPEDDRILYTCPTTPRHMASAYDKFNYKLPYSGFMGGATSFTKEHYIKINGFSNLYFGWGGEDDDIYIRVIHNKLAVERYPTDIGRYKMLRHGPDSKNTINPQRFKLLQDSGKRSKMDGLNTLQYTVVKSEVKPLYTWVLVSVNRTEILNGAYTPRNETEYMPENQ